MSTTTRVYGSVCSHWSHLPLSPAASDDGLTFTSGSGSGWMGWFVGYCYGASCGESEPKDGIIQPKSECSMPMQVSVRRKYTNQRMYLFFFRCRSIIASSF